MNSKAFPVVAVGGVVLGEGPKVLVVQRGRVPMVGQWSLPGGRVELAEGLREALKREVLEETRVCVDVGDLLDVVEIITEGFHYVVLDYLCWPLDQGVRPAPGDDARCARYVAPEDLGSLGVSEAVIRVVDKALRMWSGKTAGETR